MNTQSANNDQLEVGISDNDMPGTEQTSPRTISQIQHMLAIEQAIRGQAAYKEQFRMEVLERNAKHLEQQILPLNYQNVSLKDHILASNYYIQQRHNLCFDFSSLVKNYNQNQQSRELLKQIGDLVTIHKLLEDDINEYQTSILFLSELRKQLTGLSESQGAQLKTIHGSYAKDISDIRNHHSISVIANQKEVDCMMNEKNNILRQHEQNIVDLKTMMMIQEKEITRYTQLTTNLSKRNDELAAQGKRELNQIEKMFLDSKDKHQRQLRLSRDENHLLHEETKKAHQAEIDSLQSQFKEEINVLEERLSDADNLQLVSNHNNEILSSQIHSLQQQKDSLEMQKEVFEEQALKASARVVHLIKEVDVREQQVNLIRDQLNESKVREDSLTILYQSLLDKIKYDSQISDVNNDKYQKSITILNSIKNISFDVKLTYDKFDLHFKETVVTGNHLLPSLDMLDNTECNLEWFNAQLIIIQQFMSTQRQLNEEILCKIQLADRRQKELSEFEREKMEELVKKYSEIVSKTSKLSAKYETQKAMLKQIRLQDPQLFDQITSVQLDIKQDSILADEIAFLKNLEPPTVQEKKFQVQNEILLMGNNTDSDYDDQLSNSNEIKQLYKQQNQALLQNPQISEPHIPNFQVISQPIQASSQQVQQLVRIIECADFTANINTESQEASTQTSKNMDKILYKPDQFQIAPHTPIEENNRELIPAIILCRSNDDTQRQYLSPTSMVNLRVDLDPASAIEILKKTYEARIFMINQQVVKFEEGQILNNQKIQTLSIDVDDKSKKLETKIKEIENKTRDLEIMKKDIDSKTKRVIQLQKILNEAENKFALLLIRYDDMMKQQDDKASLQHRSELKQKQDEIDNLLFLLNRSDDELIKMDDLKRQIQQLTNDSAQKSNMIDELELQIDEYKDALGKNQDRMNDLNVQSEHQMKELHDQYLLDLNEKNKQYENLLMKVQRLQTTMDNAPSKPEDIEKLKLQEKEYSIIRTVLETHHTRLSHSTEIVKYLQLELENYKKTYNIFQNDGQYDKQQSNLQLKSLYQNFIKEAQEFNKKTSDLLFQPTRSNLMKRKPQITKRDRDRSLDDSSSRAITIQKNILPDVYAFRDSSNPLHDAHNQTIHFKTNCTEESQDYSHRKLINHSSLKRSNIQPPKFKVDKFRLNQTSLRNSLDNQDLIMHAERFVYSLNKDPKETIDESITRTSNKDSFMYKTKRS